MGAPDRVPSEEHDALNPPVIPCFKILKQGRRLPQITPEIGWEGFKISANGEGGFKVTKDGDFTLYILPDGYCEIPATPRNKAKLEILLKPMPVYAMQMIKVTDGDGKEIEVPARDPETNKVLYTDKLLRTDPPVYRRANAQRSFDSAKESTADYVRPWLRQFVSVPGAIMEQVEG